MVWHLLLMGAGALVLGAMSDGAARAKAETQAEESRRLSEKRIEDLKKLMEERRKDHEEKWGEIEEKNGGINIASDIPGLYLVRSTDPDGKIIHKSGYTYCVVSARSLIEQSGLGKLVAFRHCKNIHQMESAYKGLYYSFPDKFRLDHSTYNLPYSYNSQYDWFYRATEHDGSDCFSSPVQLFLVECNSMYKLFHSSQPTSYFNRIRREMESDGIEIKTFNLVAVKSFGSSSEASKNKTLLNQYLNKDNSTKELCRRWLQISHQNSVKLEWFYQIAKERESEVVKEQESVSVKKGKPSNFKQFTRQTNASIT